MTKTPKRRGHPSMYEGPRKRTTFRLTKQVRAVLKVVCQMLKDQGHGHKATESAALEYLVRHATRGKTPLYYHLRDAYKMPSWDDLDRVAVARQRRDKQLRERAQAENENQREMAGSAGNIT